MVRSKPFRGRGLAFFAAALVCVATLGVSARPADARPAAPIGWNPLPGGGLTPDAPVAVNYPHHQNVFVRGMDNGIWRNTFNGSSWSGWSPVPGGGLTPSAPGATVYNSRLILVVRGMDNGIWRSTVSGSGWSPVPGGGLTPSAPSAAVYHGDLSYFVRGNDNGIWQWLP